jgi:8-oxo-dGTP pyrophosphatase MutT (NUDIX family)
MMDEIKIFAIIFRKYKNQFEYLALKPYPGPGYDYDYYVITGGVEKGESLDKAVNREIREEIGLVPNHIINLKFQIDYIDSKSGNHVIEHCYGAEISSGKLKLNEEHIGYKWMDANYFINTIWWTDDRNILKNMIKDIESLVKLKSCP